MRKQDKKRPRGESSGRWGNLGNHPFVIGVGLIAALVGIVGVVYSMYGPFNLLPKTELPLTAEEWAYLDLANGAVTDTSALLRFITEPPHTRDKFDGPEYTNLSRRVADKLQAALRAEPSERLRALHSNVIVFIEKTQEVDGLMSQYSYSLDHDTFNRASSLRSEALRAMNHAMAELGRIMDKQRKGGVNQNK